MLALFDAAIATNPGTVVLSDLPVSFTSPEGVVTPMWACPVGIVPLADIPQILALLAPSRVILQNLRAPDGRLLEQDEAEAAMSWTRQYFQVLGADDRLEICQGLGTQEIAARL